MQSTVDTDVARSMAEIEEGKDSDEKCNKEQHGNCSPPLHVFVYLLLKTHIDFNEVNGRKEEGLKHVSHKPSHISTVKKQTRPTTPVVTPKKTGEEPTLSIEKQIVNVFTNPYF